MDVSGRLRATLNRNAALLEAARAGTEVARRTLILAIDDAYFGLALASARRGAAEQNWPQQQNLSVRHRFVKRR
jgi:outer membrane protein TolC